MAARRHAIRSSSHGAEVILGTAALIAANVMAGYRSVTAWSPRALGASVIVLFGASLARMKHLLISTQRIASATQLAGVMFSALLAPVASAQETTNPADSLDWSPCESAEAFECATAQVPLDYSDPSSPPIAIAVTRLRASDPEKRIGSLFVNPGGPGVPGVGFVHDAALRLFSDEVRAHFDIVGFDPRFVGASHQASCVASSAEADEVFRDIPVVPISQADERKLSDAYGRYGRLCAERAGELAHASTANVARDMDRLREAVGDTQLSYAGYSYGSVLGQTYAALFPERVRALMIDGVVDAQAWSTGSEAEQSLPVWVRVGAAVGSSETLHELLRLCGEAGVERCPFAVHGDAVASFDRLAETLRSQALQDGGGGGMSSTYANMLAMVMQYLGDPGAWDDLADLFEALWRDTFPSATPERHDGEIVEVQQRLHEHSEAGGWHPGSLRRSPGEGLSEDARIPSLAATCADTVNPRSLEAWSMAAAAEELRAPHFGRLWTYNAILCAEWTLQDEKRYLGPYDRATAAPILVVSTRFDPRTPYQGAQAVANRVPGARLLTVDGHGHTTGYQPNVCLEAAVTRYFVDQTLPAAGAVCKPDSGLPFSAEE